MSDPIINEALAQEFVEWSYKQGWQFNQRHNHYLDNLHIEGPTFSMPHQYAQNITVKELWQIFLIYKRFKDNVQAKARANNSSQLDTGSPWPYEQRYPSETS